MYYEVHSAVLTKGSIGLSCVDGLMIMYIYGAEAFWEQECHSGNQEIHISLNPKVNMIFITAHHRIITWFHWVQSTSYIFKIHFNTILSPMPRPPTWFTSLQASSLNSVHISTLEGGFYLCWSVHCCASQQLVHCQLWDAYKFCQWINMSIGQERSE
jgi:hypothetical protein